ncbi:hypothetical protein IB244_18595 [Rhizobium sp. RHZ02]|uniref:hypothetical protein n=1 Tax=Rhizobium sp. RHZ02 TaxID=2769306 RepID=UPI0017814038|nr:hypothetical protein [Rhizobium sp. RHZ02]MBD9453547.1 hypothetical protein [Rhizobium sp. RHZ02]
MDMTMLQTALGLATSAVGLTGKAAEVAGVVKGLVSSGKSEDANEAAKLLNVLAVELTSANVMNMQLSDALRRLSDELRKEDQFEQERARYVTHRTSQDDIVYKLRPEFASENEPEHFICPACLNKDRLFIFITGQGDYKICQINHEHTYRFGNTPMRPGRRVGEGGCDF